MDNKIFLRNYFLNIRNSKSSQEILNKSNIITNNFINYFEKNNLATDKYICLYLSHKNEFNTELLAKYFIQKNQKIVYPKIVKNTMEFTSFSNNDKYVYNKNGILESSSCNFISRKNIAIAIFPLVCFDKNNYRIGYGKGFYDKYFSNQKNIFKIGLAFDFQKSDKLININKFDVKLDLIITN